MGKRRSGPSRHRIISWRAIHALRPIRGAREHRRAVEFVNGFGYRPSLTADEEDYLDVLGLLIADYEDSIYEHPEFTPVERIRYLMQEHNLTQAELARRTGVAVTSLSDALNGKRRFSPRVRARLADCFGVSASFFARRSQLRTIAPSTSSSDTVANVLA
jgi:HTH-type transcriptional regulator/antitoxin HigA